MSVTLLWGVKQLLDWIFLNILADFSIISSPELILLNEAVSDWLVAVNHSIFPECQVQ